MREIRLNFEKSLLKIAKKSLNLLQVDTQVTQR